MPEGRRDKVREYFERWVPIKKLLKTLKPERDGPDGWVGFKERVTQV